MSEEKCCDVYIDSIHLMNETIDALVIDLDYARRERDQACSALYRLYRLTEGTKLVFSCDVREIIGEACREC